MTARICPSAVSVCRSQSGHAVQVPATKSIMRHRPAPDRPVTRLLQRPRAAHHGVDGVDADVARGVQRREPARRERAATAPPAAYSPSSRAQLVAHLLGAQVLEAGQSEQVAEHAQHLPGRPRLARRSRRAGHALPATLDVDPGAGGLGERRDRQDHGRVGQLLGARVRRQRHDAIRALQRRLDAARRREVRRPRCRPPARSRAGGASIISAAARPGLATARPPTPRCGVAPASDAPTALAPSGR